MNQLHPGYLPGLHGLRFFAAFIVLIIHIEKVRRLLWHQPGLPVWIADIAHLSVVFFFVLSGFLIFYRLFIAHAQTGSIPIREFYYRRILRIWPAYYITLFFGLTIAPYFSGVRAFEFDTFIGIREMLFLCMLPNVGIYIAGTVQHIGQLWSIGVEEQLYLFAPWLARRMKKSLGIFVSLLLIFLMARVVSRIWFDEETTFWKYKIMMYVFEWWEGEAFLYGALAAWVFRFRGVPSWLKHWYPITGVLICMVGYGYFMPSWHGLEKHVIGILFALLILHVVMQGSLTRFLELPWFRFWGERSYGLYIYHYPILIILASVIAGHHPSTEAQILYFICSIFGSGTVAVLLYRYVELPFLKMKTGITDNPS